MNIFIADDHPLFREALKNLMQRLYQSVDVIEADSFVELFSLLNTKYIFPDCLFLDLNMPGGNSYDHIEKLRQTYPTVPIIIITGSESAEDCRLAINKGATSFLTKSLDNTGLERAVITTLSNNENSNNEKKFILNKIPSHSQLTECLTNRQQEVFQLICEGDTNKMIARKLELTEGTVKLHVRAILQALGVNNRTQAVALNKTAR